MPKLHGKARKEQRRREAGQRAQVRRSRSDYEQDVLLSERGQSAQKERQRLFHASYDSRTLCELGLCERCEYKWAKQYDRMLEERICPSCQQTTPWCVCVEVAYESLVGLNELHFSNAKRSWELGLDMVDPLSFQGTYE